MEVNGPSWILDVERAGEKNAVNIARLYERVEQVQDDVKESRLDSKERSDERLDLIMGRFDQAEKLGGRRLGVGASFFVTVCTSVWFVVVQPIQDQMALVERRLIDAERIIAVLSADSE